jgi:Type II restriction endonuclease EcoO109I
MKNREEVIRLISIEIQWWVKQRLNKLREELHDTMTINPFLIPILFDLHHAEGFDDLGSLMLASHLMGGHNTGFGKLMDEKVLPNVFGANKLSKTYRKENPPFDQAPFDDIDHILVRENGHKYLISLKAGKWTIQLGQAGRLNSSFYKIKTQYRTDFNGIVIGVIYGNHTSLTDKYDIAIGIKRKTSANHNIKELEGFAEVKVGREFWSWLNGDQEDTQRWMMEGILDGVKKADCRAESKRLLAAYIDAFNRKYDTHISEDKTINWFDILSGINQ